MKKDQKCNNIEKNLSQIEIQKQSDTNKDGIKVADKSQDKGQDKDQNRGRNNRQNKRKRKTFRNFLVFILFLSALLLALYVVKRERGSIFLSLGDTGSQMAGSYNQASVVINENQPYFTKEEITTRAYEAYSKLDVLGRCGPAMACLSRELMPVGKREEIGMIRPTGWHTVKYPELIADRYLYNRCHLIAWCLTGENANEKNLITGTRYMNTKGMLPYEEMVANYIERTKNHVMYRVTPVFEGNNLLASGVLMEAYSVEDQGKGICFCVFCPNIQPGILIDYRTGASRAE